MIKIMSGIFLALCLSMTGGSALSQSIPDALMPGVIMMMNERGMADSIRAEIYYIEAMIERISSADPAANCPDLTNPSKNSLATSRISLEKAKSSWSRIKEYSLGSKAIVNAGAQAAESRKSLIPVLLEIFERNPGAFSKVTARVDARKFNEIAGFHQTGIDFHVIADMRLNILGFLLKGRGGEKTLASMKEAVEVFRKCQLLTAGRESSRQRLTMLAELLHKLDLTLGEWLEIRNDYMPGMQNSEDE